MVWSLSALNSGWFAAEGLQRFRWRRGAGSGGGWRMHPQRDPMKARRIRSLFHAPFRYVKNYVLNLTIASARRRCRFENLHADPPFKKRALAN
jgi:hypothetical protein